MSMEDNVSIVRQFIQRFWNEGDLGCTERFLTEDYVDHAYIPGNVAGLKLTAGSLHAAFPDQSSVEESIIAQGDRVVVRLKLEGTHRGNFRGTEATQNRINVKVYREFRLANGRIAEHWALLDTAALLRQIGAELNEHPACRINP
ncbi:ester cyclase [Cohnella panacarvi]|uniref:ester cyclase n=1 Tax=Cohnella panacarvi TaxID=400776 RepID=UPI00047BF081|nr:ester cyclase [Cohnella panacarvi]